MFLLPPSWLKVIEDDDDDEKTLAELRDSLTRKTSSTISVPPANGHFSMVMPDGSSVEVSATEAEEEAPKKGGFTLNPKKQQLQSPLLNRVTDVIQAPNSGVIGSFLNEHENILGGPVSKEGQTVSRNRFITKVKNNPDSKMFLLPHSWFKVIEDDDDDEKTLAELRDSLTRKTSSTLSVPPANGHFSMVMPDGSSVEVSASEAEEEAPKKGGFTLNPKKQQLQSPLLNRVTDVIQAPNSGVIGSFLNEHENILGGPVSKEGQTVSRIVETSLIKTKAVRTKRKLREVSQGPINPHGRIRKANWPVGLKNLGNTCWFSTVIQPLFHMPIFRKLVFSYSPKDWNVTASHINKAYILFMHELRKLFALLLGSKRKYVDPSHALEEFKKAFPDSSATDSQQDISEFIYKLIECLELVFKMNYHMGENNDNMIKESQNPMLDLFYGQFSSESHNEGGTFCNKEIFSQYPLPVSGFSNIYESLESTMTQELESCDLMTKSGQESWFTKLPPIMIFQLSRFQFNQKLGRPEKIHNKLEFPQVIYMDRYLQENRNITKSIRKQVRSFKERYKILHEQLDKLIDENEVGRKEVESLQENISGLEKKIRDIYDDPLLQNKPYRLHAVLVHAGEADSGHYWAYVFCPKQNMWLKFNDGRVSSSTWIELQKDSFGGRRRVSAYSLFYIDCLHSELFDDNNVEIGPEYLLSLPVDLKQFVEDDNSAYFKTDSFIAVAA